MLISCLFSIEFDIISLELNLGHKIYFWNLELIQHQLFLLENLPFFGVKDKLWFIYKIFFKIIIYNLTLFLIMRSFFTVFKN